MADPRENESLRAVFEHDQEFARLHDLARAADAGNTAHFSEADWRDLDDVVDAADRLDVLHAKRKVVALLLLLAAFVAAMFFIQIAPGLLTPLNVAE